MKAVILDDNISNAWDYEIILDKLDVQVLGVFKSGKEALSVIKKELPDFLILDLFLDNNEKGIDFLKQIQNYFIPTIICTAYPESVYMEEALEAGVKAFISKPLDKASLTFQIKKLIKEINENKQSNYLIVKERRNMIKVPFNEIYKIEIERNHSFIYLASKKRYVLKMSLKKLMAQLNEVQFIRCHRSTIVNLDYISAIEVINNQLILSNDEIIVLGNKYKNSIKEAFLNN